MKKSLKTTSINTVIFILFTFLLLGTSIVISYIPYTNWWDLIDRTTIKTVNNLDEQITNEIDVFIKDAKHLNMANKGLIEKNIIDMNDQAIRESFFVDALSSFDNDSIYSFSYGSEAGEYYGARKNENNEIEIMRNNKDTFGNSWYYSVEDDKAVEKVLDAGKFDPRTRDWYQAAKKTKKIVFSPIYKHFVLDDLVISSSISIFNKEGEFQGVLGSHINLSRIDNYLENLVHKENACAMIIEKNSGNIIANCSDKAYFKRGKSGELERISINEIKSKAALKAYEKYLENGSNTYKMDSENGVEYI